jgi:cytochrome c oxidase subunit 2
MLCYFHLAISAFFIVTIGAAVIYFCVKYRRRSPDERPGRIPTSKTLEITWTVIPFLIVLVMFFWGTEVFFQQRAIPDNAMEIQVTGKKWMWKFQHLNGRREINDLHVPVGVPIKLKMASEDVIHDVSVPAFRIKQDVMPGRYTYEWFQATKIGNFHLFCDQYCGTDHSRMIGTVVVMEPEAYQKWLAGYSGQTPEQVGEGLFTKMACNTCHMAGAGQRGPVLSGLIGSKVALNNGQVITADENYVRESIMNPQAKVVAGFQPIMPNFNGVLTQDQVNSLIAYVKTLKGGAVTPGQVQASAGSPSAGSPPVNSSVIPAVQDSPSSQTASQPKTPVNTPAAVPAAPKPAPAPASTSVGNQTSSNAAESSASVKADLTSKSGSAAGSTVK